MGLRQGFSLRHDGDVTKKQVLYGNNWCLRVFQKHGVRQNTRFVLLWAPLADLGLPALGVSNQPKQGVPEIMSSKQGYHYPTMSSHASNNAKIIKSPFGQPE